MALLVTLLPTTIGGLLSARASQVCAEATPQDKLDSLTSAVRKQKDVWWLCATVKNDAPALAQAVVGVAMQSGTQATREAGNMVDIDFDPCFYGDGRASR